MPSMSNSITTSGSDSVLPPPPKRIKVKTLDLPERWLVIPTFTNTVAQLSCYIRTRLSLAEGGDYDIYLDGSLIVPEETIEVVRDGDSIHVYPSGHKPPARQTSYQENLASSLDILKGQPSTNSGALPPRPPGRHPPIQLLFSQSSFRNDGLGPNSQGPYSATTNRVGSSDDAESKPRRVLSEDGKKRRNARNRRRERRRRQEAREAKATHSSSITEHKASTTSSHPVSNNLATSKSINMNIAQKRNLSETDASKTTFMEAKHTPHETIEEKTVRETNPFSLSMRSKESTVPPIRGDETYMEEVENHKEDNVSQDRSAVANPQNRETAAAFFEEDPIARHSSQLTEKDDARSRLPFASRREVGAITLPEVIDLLSDDDEIGEVVSKENEFTCSSVKEESIPQPNGAETSNDGSHSKNDCRKEMSTRFERASGQPVPSNTLDLRDKQSCGQSMPPSPSFTYLSPERQFSTTIKGVKTKAPEEMHDRETRTESAGPIPEKTCLDSLSGTFGNRHEVVHMKPVNGSEHQKALKRTPARHNFSDCAVRSVDSVPSISIATSEIHAADQLIFVDHRAEKAVPSDLSAEINEIVKMLDGGDNTKSNSGSILQRTRKDISEPKAAKGKEIDQPVRITCLPTEETADEISIAVPTESSKAARNAKLNQRHDGDRRLVLTNETHTKSRNIRPRGQGSRLKEPLSKESGVSRTEPAQKPCTDASDKDTPWSRTVRDGSKKRKAPGLVSGNPPDHIGGSQDPHIGGSQDPPVNRKQRQDANYTFSYSKTGIPQQTLSPESATADEFRPRKGKQRSGSALDGKHGTLAIKEYISELLNEILDGCRVNLDGTQRENRDQPYSLSRMDDNEHEQQLAHSDIIVPNIPHHKDLRTDKKASLDNLHEATWCKEPTPVKDKHDLQNKETPNVVEDRSVCVPNAKSELKGTAASQKRGYKFSSVSSALRYAREHDMLKDTKAAQSKALIEIKPELLDDSERKPAKRKKRRKLKGKLRPEDMLYEEQHNQSILLGFDDCLNHELPNDASIGDGCSLPPLSLLESAVDMRDPALFINTPVVESPKNCVQTTHSSELQVVSSTHEKGADSPRTCADSTDRRSTDDLENAADVSGVSRSVSGAEESRGSVVLRGEVGLDECRQRNSSTREKCCEEKSTGHGRSSAEPVQSDTGKWDSSKHTQAVDHNADLSDRLEAKEKEVKHKERDTLSQLQRHNLQDTLGTEAEREKEKQKVAEHRQLAENACVANAGSDFEINAEAWAFEQNEVTTTIDPHLEFEENSKERDPDKGRTVIKSSKIQDAAGSGEKIHAHSFTAPEALNGYREKGKFFDDLVSLMIDTTVALEFVFKKLSSSKHKDENDEYS